MSTEDTEYDTDQIQKLIEGELSWPELQQEVMPDPKDPQRFEKVRQVLQEKVDWDETILVPLNDHLYVVSKDGERIVKAECGHEFCSADENWREHSGVRVLEDQDEWAKFNSKWQSPDPEWQFQLREFICPECYQLLSVDAVPVGYPVINKFEPDIDTFYEDWLDRPAPDNA